MDDVACKISQGVPLLFAFGLNQLAKLRISRLQVRESVKLLQQTSKDKASKFASVVPSRVSPYFLDLKSTLFFLLPLSLSLTQHLNISHSSYIQSRLGCWEPSERERDSSRSLTRQFLSPHSYSFSSSLFSLSPLLCSLAMALDRTDSIWLTHSHSMGERERSDKSSLASLGWLTWMGRDLHLLFLFLFPLPMPIVCFFSHVNSWVRARQTDRRRVSQSVSWSLGWTVGTFGPQWNGQRNNFQRQHYICLGNLILSLRLVPFLLIFSLSLSIYLSLAVWILQEKLSLSLVACCFSSVQYLIHYEPVQFSWGSVMLYYVMFCFYPLFSSIERDFG